jgi:hypothetical protein
MNWPRHYQLAKTAGSFVLSRPVALWMKRISAINFRLRCTLNP